MWGKDKVTMDFAFFAIAFNIKRCAQNWKRQERTSLHLLNLCLLGYL